jgi:hypothetical protein
MHFARASKRHLRADLLEQDELQRDTCPCTSTNMPSTVVRGGVKAELLSFKTIELPNTAKFIPGATTGA